MSTVTVVIRAFTEDRLPATRQAIESVLAQTRRPDEVLVVIDHNEPLLETIRADFADNASVVVIANERRRGIGGGSNTALLRATGHIVAYLDDDAAAEPGWLAALIDQMAAPEIVGVGGRTLPNWIDGERPAWFPEEFNWVYGCSNVDGRSDTQEIRNVWGGNNAFRRQDLIDHGGFIEEGLGRVGSRPIGCEDTELCIRIRQYEPEARFLYEPTAVIRHQVPASRTSLSYFRSRCFLEGVSKALLSSQRGNRASLDEEFDYTRRTLASALARSLGSAVRERRGSELLKAGAIVFGLTCAVAGLVYGRSQLLVGAAKRLPAVDRPLQPSPTVG